MFTLFSGRHIGVSLRVHQYGVLLLGSVNFRETFRRISEVFHLAWPTSCATNIFCSGLRKLLRKVKNYGFVVRFPSNSQLALDLHQANQPIRSLHFLNLTFVARQDRWKTRNIDPKLAMKQCCTAGWGLLNQQRKLVAPVTIEYTQLRDNTVYRV